MAIVRAGRVGSLCVVVALAAGCSSEESGTMKVADKAPFMGAPIDLDGDGKVDGVTVDTNGDGVADGVDTNGDGAVDKPLPQGGGAGSGGGNTGSASGGTTGGSSTPAPMPVEPAEVVLPEYPYYDNDAITPDKSVLEEQGGRFCAAKPEDTSDAAFFYGFMPLDTVDMLCDPRNQSWPSIEKLMGNMYLSGYFGGIWFRDNAQSGGIGRPQGTGQGMTSETDFQNLVKQIRTRIDLSTKGSEADVLAQALRATDTDLTRALESTPLIYAYNKGYAQSVLNNAPQEVKDAPPFTCTDYLDCQTPGVKLSTFERFRPSLAKLKANENTCAAPLIGNRPTDTNECRWAAMEDREENSKTWESVGGGLWLGGDFSAETYKTLLTINAGYLLVAGASFLGSMQGWADEDVPAARCSILVDTAAYIWNQAYFQGLNSSAKGKVELPDGGVMEIGPEVHCPAEASAK